MITTIQRHDTTNEKDRILQRFYSKNLPQQHDEKDDDVVDDLAVSQSSKMVVVDDLAFSQSSKMVCWMEEDISCHETVATVASTATNLTRRASMSSIDNDSQHYFEVPTPAAAAPTSSSAASLELWVEQEDDEEMIDEATKALQDRIAALQTSLELTKQRETREIQRIQKSTERKKLIVAETIRKAYHTQQLKKQTLVMQHQGKLIRVLQEMNTDLKRKSQQVTKAITNLLESNVRLQLATEESQECLAKYQRLLIRPEQAKAEKLTLELEQYRSDVRYLKTKMEEAKDDATNERNGRRKYGASIGKLLHKVQHAAWDDRALLQALNQLLNSYNR